MRTLLNIIWLLFAGLWIAIAYLIAALICFLLIITIPFGVAAMRIAAYALWPFGRTVVRKPTAGAASCVGNALWLIFAGWWLALAHLIHGITLCLTIIGIPFGIATFKLIPVSLTPLGMEIIDVRSPRGY